MINSNQYIYPCSGCDHPSPCFNYICTWHQSQSTTDSTTLMHSRDTAVTAINVNNTVTLHVVYIFKHIHTCIFVLQYSNHGNQYIVLNINPKSHERSNFNILHLENCHHHELSFSVTCLSLCRQLFRSWRSWNRLFPKSLWFTSS